MRLLITLLQNRSQRRSVIREGGPVISTRLEVCKLVLILAELIWIKIGVHYWTGV